MKIENVFYLPSGRIFLVRTDDKFLIEATEMRDVAVDGKNREEVRNSLDPHIIWKHLVPYENKWLLTVSTQKGCPHICRFCDVGNIDFKGNLTQEEIEEQVKLLLLNTPYVNKSNKVKIGFARMGEPSHNLENVLGAIKNLPKLDVPNIDRFNWLPCFNSILPTKTLENNTWQDVIDSVIDVKENNYNGFLHFQLSCNSTDEIKRKELFGGAEIASIKDIIKYVNTINITNRTVTLNFIVIDNVEVSVDKLLKLGLNGEKFVVKLIPLNKTENSQNNDLKTYANYENYDKLKRLNDEFLNAGIPVVFDAIARCEEAGLCCGQLAQIYQ